MISVCTPLLSILSTMQCNITEIKPQAGPCHKFAINFPFGLFTLKNTGGLHHTDSLLYDYEFSCPAITKHSVTPLNIVVHTIYKSQH